MMRTAVAMLVCVIAALSAGCGKNGAGTPSMEDAMIEGHVRELNAMLPEPSVAATEVMLLGTFHFANPGADAHQSKYTYDVFSERGQRELGEVLDRLEAYRPTKIFVERGSQHQGQVDEWYASYREGKQENIANEIVTVAFALAKRLGHERVYGFDARGEWLASAPQTSEQFTEIAKRMGKEWAFEDPMDKRYSAMYGRADEIEETLTLRQRLRLMNNAEMLRRSHGAYLYFSAFRVNDGTEFPGPDLFASMWHNRNLRMFSTIQRLAEPGDRVLVVVGAGHVPILQQCVKACPTMEWVAVDEYLGAEAPEERP